MIDSLTLHYFNLWILKLKLRLFVADIVSHFLLQYLWQLCPYEAKKKRICGLIVYQLAISTWQELALCVTDKLEKINSIYKFQWCHFDIDFWMALIKTQVICSFLSSFYTSSVLFFFDWMQSSSFTKHCNLFAMYLYEH